MKRLLSVFILMSVILSFTFGLTINADAADNKKCGENLSWSYSDDGVLTVTGTGEMYNYSDKQPAAWKDLDITKVIIEPGVTSVGSYAFNRCFSLSEVSIPEGIKNIGNGAFMFCTSLKEVKIPSSVDELEEAAFYYCTSLEKITLPDNLKKIGNGVFFYCTNLGNTKIPDSVNSIGEYAFYKCWKFSDVKIPKGINKLNRFVFYGCTGITEIDIPKNVKAIEDYAFYGCTNLEKVNISDKTSVGTDVFEYTKFVYNGKQDKTTTQAEKNNNMPVYEISEKIATENEFYSITFVGKNGRELTTIGIEIIDGEKVQYGNIPESPQAFGYRFIGWDQDIDAITSDTTVNAEYESIISYYWNNLTDSLKSIFA